MPQGPKLLAGCCGCRFYTRSRRARRAGCGSRGWGVQEGYWPKGGPLPAVDGSLGCWQLGLQTGPPGAGTWSGGNCWVPTRGDRRLGIVLVPIPCQLDKVLPPLFSLSPTPNVLDLEILAVLNLLSRGGNSQREG